MTYLKVCFYVGVVYDQSFYKFTNISSRCSMFYMLLQCISKAQN